ncbi:MAG: nitrilase-related carbon-nitrogen hydrolase, partial [Candidatus Puniceispirillum sp.]
MSQLTRVAITQMSCDWDVEANLAKAEAQMRAAAANGAHIVLLQELIATP